MVKADPSFVGAGRRRAATLLLPLLLAACGSEGPTQPTASGAAPSPSPRPSPSATARYRVAFEATWSRDTHPTDIPSNPHFSGLIGGTHRSSVRFWQPGSLATEGIRLMAERGRQSPLDLEVEAAIRAGHAERVLAGDDVPSSPGATTLDFTVSLEYPLVTLVTMVAPSPDWFVGVSGLNLLESGDWAAETAVDLYPYDAGTDSGATFTARDAATVPPEPIHRLGTGPVVVEGQVPRMGRFVFRRLP